MQVDQKTLVVIAAHDYTLSESDYAFLSVLIDAWAIDRMVLLAPIDEGDAAARIYYWGDSKIGNIHIVHPDQIRYGSRANQMQIDELLSDLDGDAGDMVMAFGSDAVTSEICMRARHEGVKTATLMSGGKRGTR